MGARAGGSLPVRVAIVGAGVVGAAIARLLTRYEGFEVHLFERNADVGWGASKANSALLHPGHAEDPRRFPLRARLCARGNRLWHLWAEELDVPTRWPGELMLAFSEEESRSVFGEYLERAISNGVPGVRVVGKEELKALEPNVNPSAVGALWAPTAGVIAPWEATIALVENAVENGASLHAETEVRRVVVEGGRVRGIDTSEGFFEAEVVVNAAGIHADSISRSAGVDFELRPRRGEYYIFEEDAYPKVRRILHPTPTPKTKGVYASVTVEGNLLIGPNAEDLPPWAKEELSTSRSGLDFVWEEASRLVAELPPRSRVVKTFAGIRPEPPGSQWVLEAYDDPWGFVNAAGMRSPALTAAPAIAEHVVEELMGGRYGFELRERASWNPRREGIRRLKEMGEAERERAIGENPLYGNVICMCKEVSEAEIAEAVRRMRRIGLKTVTLDGVKFRTLSTFGWCQGSFCRVRVARIVSGLLGIPHWSVAFRDGEVTYGVGDVKVLLSGSKGDGSS